MSTKFCQHCGTQNLKDSKFCSSCGGQFEFQQQSLPASVSPAETYTQDPLPPQPQPLHAQYVGSPKDRVVAGILALLLGGLGIHKFYLDNISSGLLYLCFCWTGIPEIIGFIEGIIYLTQTDEEFSQNYVHQRNI